MSGHFGRKMLSRSHFCVISDSMESGADQALFTSVNVGNDICLDKILTVVNDLV